MGGHTLLEIQDTVTTASRQLVGLGWVNPTPSPITIYLLLRSLSLFISIRKKQMYQT